MARSSAAIAMAQPTPVHAGELPTFAAAIAATTTSTTTTTPASSQVSHSVLELVTAPASGDFGLASTAFGPGLASTAFRSGFAAAATLAQASSLLAVAFPDSAAAGVLLTATSTGVRPTVCRAVCPIVGRVVPIGVGCRVGGVPLTRIRVCRHTTSG